MGERIVFTSAGKVELEQFDPPSISENQVNVHTEYTLVSTGTETIVHNRLFDPGTHWDNWVKYPFFPGYAAVGLITHMGSAATEFKVGDRVVLRGGHASDHIVPKESCYLVPECVSSKDAPWFALAKIAAMGARTAEYKLGDNVLIIGAGPIGQMSIRWAHAAGARTIIVVDRISQRLSLATAGGATHTIAKPLSEAMENIKAANGGELTRVVVDTTGHPDVFAWALAATGRMGRVVLLGDTGRPALQHLTPDVISKGLTIIGAHDSHEDATWNTSIITRTFFDLASSGRFSLDGLNTHTFAPRECVAAYDLASNHRDETMGIIFDWSAK